MNKIQQFYVYSLTEERIRNAEYNLNLELYQAKTNEEVIALADNECLREIRRITNHPFCQETLENLLIEKKRLQKKNKNTEIRIKIQQLYNNIDKQLFIPEFVCVQTAEKAKYRRLGNKGFTLNGEKYIRLMCGAGHARTNRTMFVQKKIWKELDKFLRCGCNDIELIEAKWNAYYALGSSATLQVSEPRVCVIHDKEIEMTKTVDFVTEAQPQDIITREEKTLKFNLWDGMGLVSPQRAEQWGKEIGCDYIPSAFIIRNAFIKGLVTVFDFHQFGETVAHSEIVTDIYGKQVNIKDVDVIITESQFKLWKAYDSWEDYLKKNHELGWHWGITKCADKYSELKVSMRTNYQFLQVLDLDYANLEKLCQPTVDWFKNITGESYEQTILYLFGKLADRDLSAQEMWDRISDPFIKCVLVNKDLLKDDYIKSRIMNSINKKIREAYMGRLAIHSTYQFLIPDPYALCEHLFGMKVVGLLKEGEHYNRYWLNQGAKRLSSMRSPLTWRSDIIDLNLVENDKIKEWYKYIDNGTVFNVWGVDFMLSEGADADGDCSLVTNNEYIEVGKCK